MKPKPETKPGRVHNNPPELVVAEKPRRKRYKPKPPPVFALDQRPAYRVAEVCGLLNVSVATFWRRAKAGTIKLTYLGPTPFVTAEHLSELLGDEHAE
jgi:hypothetical protein